MTSGEWCGSMNSGSLHQFVAYRIALAEEINRILSATIKRLTIR